MGSFKSYEKITDEQFEESKSLIKNSVIFFTLKNRINMIKEHSLSTLMVPKHQFISKSMLNYFSKIKELFAIVREKFEVWGN